MSLWCMAKSPIMYGGDLRKIDAWTLGLITNPTLLNINIFSSDNHEACEISLSSSYIFSSGNLMFLKSYTSVVSASFFCYIVS